MKTKGYIGTYTKKDGKGIYRFDVDENDQTIEKVEVGYEVEASTYVTNHNQFLYAIKKDGDDCGVASFLINEDGSLTFINDCLASQEGTGCHISVSKDGQFLFEAVYGAGLVRLYKLDPENGGISGLIDVYRAEGHGPNEARQESSHVHFVQQTPDLDFLATVDLGADAVRTFKFSDEGLELVETLETQAGSGPRHLAFHPNGDYAYLVNELSNTIQVLSYKNGKFAEISPTLMTIHEDFDLNSQVGAVRLSHDGQFIYVSNRGHNSIAVYKILGDGALIETVEIITSGGTWPRDFNITPSDSFLVVAHEHSYNLVLFSRNKETGKLTEIENEQKAAEGVCVQFI
ncbi:lactonase family protein [Mammaliicoccus vitulinus]|uniref:6-phosphogluconolactonase n=1 Tax=Mammaliicoccus vitulinus TaxID=71237 RepID=UPI002DBC8FC5|nr:lactonase family protein [Mammaliicoccus vitulinus]MEB7658206.1 lactonase family protein [Mammaliicoccus vitulinus]